MFRALASNNFAPFENLRLELPSVPDKPENLAEIQLFTGVNGTGKTRILTVLSAMLGNPMPLGKRMKNAEPAQLYALEKLTGFDSFGQWPRLLASANQVSWQMHSEFSAWCQRVPAFAYSGYAYVADAAVSPMGTVNCPGRQDCLSFYRPEASSQVLLQAAPQGRSAQLVKLLEASLSEITGMSFQFKIEKFPSISLYAVWGGTSLPFDVLPDGLRAIIGWLVHALVMLDVWLQGKADPRNTNAVFLLDEIESHLHPAWQRKILPAFQRMFPKAQIFVATHSPFVIASLNHGWIHSLKVGPNGKVTVEKPRPAGKGESYISVVEDIMGVKEWFDPETEGLLAEFRGKRDAAYDPAKTLREREQAQHEAEELGMKIGERSMELDLMMGKELNQMRRQLIKPAGKA
jgi:AAA domain, putative AbiEii toxin, Type IV TA system